MTNLFDELIAKKYNEYNKILTSDEFKQAINKLYQLIYSTIKNGGKIMVCGNGGSAADSLHIVSEFIGRLNKTRTALPAISLCSDISTLTGLGNDFSYNNIFNRQIEALGNSRDLLVALSTSGNSKNVCNALEIANIYSIKTCVITNETGGQASKLSEFVLKIPSTNTQTVQEMTILIFHLVCEMLELKYYE